MSPHENEYERMKPLLDDISTRICTFATTKQDRLGLVVLVATHFVGTAAGILHDIAWEKNGPDLDIAGWAGEVAKLIVSTSQKERH